MQIRSGQQGRDWHWKISVICCMGFWFTPANMGMWTWLRYGSDLLTHQKLGQWVKRFKSYHLDRKTHRQTCVIPLPAHSVGKNPTKQRREKMIPNVSCAEMRCNVPF